MSTLMPAAELVLMPKVAVGSIEERAKTAASFKDDGRLDEQELHTPTSIGSRLAAVAASCPPAPKKPRRAVQCKRRLLWPPPPELISVGAEEMEQLFRLRPRRRQCVSMAIEEHQHSN